MEYFEVKIGTIARFVGELGDTVSSTERGMDARLPQGARLWRERPWRASS